MHYQFNINLNDQNYYEFNKFHSFKTSYTRPARLVLRFGFPILILILCFFILMDYSFDPSSYIFIIPYVILILAVELLYKPLTCLILRLNIRSIKKREKNVYSKTSVMDFHDDNFVEATPEHKTEQSYTAIDKVYVFGEKYIFIYMNHAMAFLLPNNVFANDNMRSDFISFLKSKDLKINYVK